MGKSEIIVHSVESVSTEDEVINDEAGDEGWVTFDGPDDASNPFNWSTGYKWSLTVLISAMTFSVNCAILMSAPATPQILNEFNCMNSLYGTLLVSIWELGEVFGPLLLAPLSELYGRLPVYHVTTILFVLLSIAASHSTSIEMLIAVRFLLGLNVASLVLNPCIVGDIFSPEQRGKALSIMGIVPYIAPCFGPLVGSAVTKALGWRWIFWLVAIITGTLEVVLLFLLRETYSVAILQKKAKKLQTLGFDARVRPDGDMIELSRTARFWVSILRPLKLFFTDPIIPLISICASVGMSMCYVVITSMARVFGTMYAFSDLEIGLSYLGIGLGMVFGVIIGGITIDKLDRGKTNHGEPERRLPLMAISYFMIPLGLLIFGWTTQAHVHWIVPIMATFLLGFSFTAMTLALWAYLIDSFGVFVASAIAAVTVVRNAASATLPLAGPPLEVKLGLGLEYTVFTSIVLVLLPAVLILIRYGKRLRGMKLSYRSVCWFW